MDKSFVEIRRWRQRSQAALWIAADCGVSDAKALLSLDWPLVWSALPSQSLSRALENARDRYHVIKSRAEVPPEGRSGGLRFIYDVERGDVSTVAAQLRARRAAELENLLEGWVGAILVAGQLAEDILKIIEVLAPSATVFRVEAGSGSSGAELAEWLALAEEVPGDHEAIDLKDALGVRFDRELLEPISDAWELLTKRIVSPNQEIEQEDFDAFLSGDSAWPALATGAAMHRGSICLTDRGRTDPIQALLNLMKKVDRDNLDPNEALGRMRIFAETGSGCTTLLRQAALSVARAGYPVLISQPFPRALRAADVNRLIINVQDEWARHREGKGSGSGTLPFCLILDADAEPAFQAESFARTVSTDLNRKLVIVTAYRRSRDEIRESTGTIKLYADTTRQEILSIGGVLRDFCQHWNLAHIPSDQEWGNYYSSFGRIRSRFRARSSGAIDKPALFLVGLYPFVKERVRDERSLTRYLYRRWSAIVDAGSRLLVEVLATAAAFGCAIPLECLMREPELSAGATSLRSKEDERASDFFVDWVKYGAHTRNWSLELRHPALGLLLMSAIRPQEALAPFSPLKPILTRMYGIQSDVWFAEQLAYRLGQYFQSSSPRFSLESDTPIQQASREIFDAIPDSVSKQSRVINHHRARYYIHLLHGCLELIQWPNATQVPLDNLKSTAEGAIVHAERLIQIASEVSQSRERLTNVMTTLAAACLKFAEVLSPGDRSEARKYFRKAIDGARDAVADDVANGHALFTFVNSIQKLFEAIALSEISAAEALQLFVSAEDRINTLFELQESRLWRNVEAENAEISIIRLAEEHNKLAQRLNKNPLVKEYVLQTPGANAAIKLRQILEKDSLRQAFADPTKMDALRRLRADLAANGTSGQGLLDLRYRLQVSDPVGRFDFESRNTLLDQMALHQPEDYAHYLHDHAAVAFQLGKIERSEQLFGSLRASRVQDPNIWIWHNERIFVLQDGDEIKPRLVVVRVTDAQEGWASYDGRTKVKFQPRQWGQIQDGEYLKVYLRFRLSGLQAVDRRLANFDLKAMGIERETEGPRP